MRVAVTRSTPVRNPRNSSRRGDYPHLMRTERRRGESTPRFLNRELSWLDFNARVLEVASDPKPATAREGELPLDLHANLDEFFMVRVAGLKHKASAGITVRWPAGAASGSLRDPRARRCELSGEQAKLWNRRAAPPGEAGHRRRGVDDLDGNESQALGLLRREIFPVLTPLAVDPSHRSPTSLAFRSTWPPRPRPRTGEERFARVKVPALLRVRVEAARAASCLSRS